MLEVLYPKDYIKAEPKVEAVKDTTKLKAFIKELVKDKPILVEEVIKLVDVQYVESNDEDYHFLAQDIEAVCQEIDKEYRPVDEPTLPEAGL
jgi:hypothetical protein